MKLVKSITERIATAISPAKRVEYNKEKTFQKSAPSIREACTRTICALESTTPLSLRSKAHIEKVNEVLKILKAKDVYKNSKA